MKTKYSSLVSVKKNIMQKSEQVLQSKNATLFSAKEALENSIKSLSEIETPQSGNISEFLASRTLLDSQRGLIKHNEEWVSFANGEVLMAKEQLKQDMIEYEKFNYLELQEIKEALKKRQHEESKELDEIALMTYENNKKQKEAS